ncbi:branched-chain amino acid ABC transporter substrate-binding protein [Zoogloea sp.]|uniref:branched-chain amino acid ABC transporter substrate-binding protein n=1 Tax=Zoogloea sp. TaxID=49181 RepID=UPI002606A53C|nr:branched-chain amino acid ABC transporter substrate-binding protein [uncultured Zoogloea sp.]MCK6386915.1 branched-chain amino acid ABC transporter substrate-binding protein [Zoogloea sp.]
MKQSALMLALAGLTMTASTAAMADVVVKLGFAGPLTGPVSHLGKDEQYGAQLALDDANGKGVVLGGQKVRFELLAEDDQADPRTATTVAQRLVDAGVKGVVGHVTSGAAIPASRIYEQAGVPSITPSATSPKLTQQKFKTTYRVIANDMQQGAAMARFATEALKAKRIAVIDDRTAYGQGLADAVVDNLKRLGVTPVGREFTNDKATDFSAILTRLKAAKPDAIFYGGMDAQGAPLLRQMRQLGIEARYLGGDGVCTTEMIKLAGPAISADVFCTQAGIPMDKMPAGKSFNERFLKRFSVPVQLYAPYSYDAASALVEAMKLADSADPARYLPLLQKVSFKGVTGNVAFDASGDIREGGVALYQYQSGKWQLRP